MNYLQDTREKCVLSLLLLGNHTTVVPYWFLKELLYSNLTWKDKRVGTSTVKVERKENGRDATRKET